MSAFKELRDVSNIFEGELRKISSDLFSARVEENFEDKLAKKLKELTFYKSKLNLLQGKVGTSESAPLEKDLSTVEIDYSDTVSWKIIEQLTAKRVMQAHTVKKLIKTLDSQLDPDQVERKQNILKYLKIYTEQDSELRTWEQRLRNTLDEHATVKEDWFEKMMKLRKMSAAASDEGGIDTSTPLYNQLQTLVGKMEMMQWLLPKLVTIRNNRYDWLSDPHNRLNALKIFREPISIEKFMNS